MTTPGCMFQPCGAGEPRQAFPWSSKSSAADGLYPPAAVASAATDDERAEASAVVRDSAPSESPLLRGLLIDYCRPLGGVTDVALCGSGSTAPRSPHGPFLNADHPALTEVANALQRLFRVHGPRPGDRLTVPHDADPRPAAPHREPARRPIRRTHSPRDTAVTIRHTLHTHNIRGQRTAAVLTREFTGSPAHGPAPA